MTKATVRKQAQRILPTLAGQRCEMCGVTEYLSRHHPDYNKPTVFQIVCKMCHPKADARDGQRKVKQEKRCKVCGKGFMPTHSKKHNTCSRECLREIGRLNAYKRWGHGQETGNKTSPV